VFSVHLSAVRTSFVPPSDCSVQLSTSHSTSASRNLAEQLTKQKSNSTPTQISTTTNLPVPTPPSIQIRTSFSTHPNSVLPRQTAQRPNRNGQLNNLLKSDSTGRTRQIQSYALCILQPTRQSQTVTNSSIIDLDRHAYWIFNFDPSSLGFFSFWPTYLSRDEIITVVICKLEAIRKTRS